MRKLKRAVSFSNFTGGESGPQTMVIPHTQRGTSGTSSPKTGVTSGPLTSAVLTVTGSVESVKYELKGQFWSAVSIY